MYDLISVGESIVDTYLVNGNIQKYAGGAPLNLVSVCAKYNLRTAFISAIGNDENSKIIYSVLDKYNIDKKYISKCSTTSTSLVTLDSNGDRSFTFTFEDNIPCNLSMPIDNLECKILYFGSLPLFNGSSKLYIDNLINNTNLNLALDVNYRSAFMNVNSYKDIIFKYINKVRYLKISYDEACILFDEKSRKKLINILSNLGVKFILFSDSNNGAYLIYNHNSFHYKPSAIIPVDTTGAGDILFGSFLYYLIKNNLYDNNSLTSAILNDALKFAVINATKSTLKQGAIASIPELKEE